MNAFDLHVDHVHHRYVTDALDAQTRLDRLWRLRLPASLESVLAGPEFCTGEWCLRRVSATVEVDLDSSDDVIARRWAAAIGLAVRTSVDQSAHRTVLSNDVVYYASRAAAVSDWMMSVALDSTPRWWAWRQLGLVRGSKPSTAEMSAQLTRFLVDHPHHIVARLQDASRVGLLDAVIGIFTETEAVALAVALAPHSAPTIRAFSSAQPVASTEIDDRLAPLTQRVLTDSVIATALADKRPAGQSAAVGQAVMAVLAVSETDPAWATRATSRDWTSILILLSTVIDGSNPRQRTETDRQHVVPPDFDAPGLDTSARFGEPSVAAADSKAAQLPEPEIGNPNRLTQVGDPAAEAARRVHNYPPTVPSSDDGGMQSDDHEPSGPPTTATIDESDIPVATQGAGLLFLLHLIDEEFIDRIGLAFEENRTIRWGLYQIGRRLLASAGVDARDAVAFVLSGASPTPSRAERSALSAEAFDPEAGALLEFCAELIDRLTARAAETGAGELDVSEIIRRPATIVSQTGWIEILLPSDTVSTDVRRAGLDLDPGWIPWLGSVVRFRYV
jgi:hypothetical protein